MRNKSGLVKSFGILQVFILVVGVVAMSWMMGVGFGEGSVGRKVVGEKIAGKLGGEVIGKWVAGVLGGGIVGEGEDKMFIKIKGGKA